MASPSSKPAKLPRPCACADSYRAWSVRVCTSRTYSAKEKKNRHLSTTHSVLSSPLQLPTTHFSPACWLLLYLSNHSTTYLHMPPLSPTTAHPRTSLPLPMSVKRAEQGAAMSVRMAAPAKTDVAWSYVEYMAQWEWQVEQRQLFFRRYHLILPRRRPLAMHACRRVASSGWGCADYASAVATGLYRLRARLHLLLRLGHAPLPQRPPLRHWPIPASQVHLLPFLFD